MRLSAFHGRTIEKIERRQTKIIIYFTVGDPLHVVANYDDEEDDLRVLVYATQLAEITE